MKNSKWKKKLCMRRKEMKMETRMEKESQGP